MLEVLEGKGGGLYIVYSVGDLWPSTDNSSLYLDR